MYNDEVSLGWKRRESIKDIEVYVPLESLEERKGTVSSKCCYGYCGCYGYRVCR